MDSRTEATHTHEGMWRDVHSSPARSTDRYLFDNSAVDWAAQRFTALETCYDPVSRRNLARTGAGPGWRCLEVGGGNGSVGTWLAEQVGPSGDVVVTDIAPSSGVPAPSHDNLRVLQHDVVRDALPEGEFDLVHARLVLLHLPQRHAVLRRLIRSLKPGGHLVLEEFDCGHLPVLHAPEGSGSLFVRVHEALMSCLADAGADPLWGRRVHGALVDAGCEGVRSSVHAESWHGGDAGMSLHHANTAQARPELLDAGVSEDELAAFWRLLDTPGFAVQSYPLVAAHGHRPR